MDPNATLKELRELCENLRDCNNDAIIDEDPLWNEAKLDNAAELVDRFKALDDWISNGGFIPEAWRKGRTQ